MRGIYILGIVIILLIVIGVLFYYENIKFDINVIPYSLTSIARIRPIVSRITIHWPSFYNVVTGKTLALPNLIALQHIPLSPGQVALFGEMCAEPLFVYFSKYIQICIRS